MMWCCAHSPRSRVAANCSLVMGQDAVPVVARPRVAIAAHSVAWRGPCHRTLLAATYGAASARGSLAHSCEGTMVMRFDDEGAHEDEDDPEAAVKAIAEVYRQAVQDIDKNIEVDMNASELTRQQVVAMTEIAVKLAQACAVSAGTEASRQIVESD